MAKIKVTINEGGFEREVEIEAPEGTGSWPKPDQMHVLGKRTTRLEAPDKVTGRARYTYDVNLPGLLYGKIIRSPHAHARIAKIDVTKAKALPGVKAVIVIDPNKEVTYQGDEIAALAAVSSDVAEDAARLIDIQYDLLPHVASIDDARKPGAPRAIPNRDNVGREERSETGDANSAFAAADAAIDANYSTQVQTHVCLETHGVVCKWDGDELTVWASTQGVQGVRDELAREFGLPASKVHAITEHMGGGFGSKFGAGVEGSICARLAKDAKAPVKLMLDRKEEHLAVGNRPSIQIHMKAAGKKTGELTALETDSYATGGVGGGAGYPMPYVYSCPNTRIAKREVFINAGAARAFRAPGCPPAAYLMESMMDDLAEKLGVDPLEFRRKNDPNQTRQKQYDMGAERIGWATRRNKVPGSAPGPVKRGIGMGSGAWGGGGGPADIVTTRIHRDGSVEVLCGVQDLGTGTRTAIGVVAAEELGLQPHELKVAIGHTDYGPSNGSGGSVTIGSVSPAAKTSAANAKMQLFQKVAPSLGVTANDLSAQNGRVFATKDPAKGMSWKDACAKLDAAGISAQGSWIPGLNSSGTAGTQFAEVEVDTETGRVRPLRVVAVHDCGLVVNRLTAESQIYGGVLMGLSFALLEDRILDGPTGRMVNPNMEDYKVVGCLEVPQIDVILMDMPERGVIGLGEPPVIPTAAAIANAVYNAIGVRVRDLPITPDKVLTALSAKAKEA
jgi:xanthine dehydrogenase YagR molybdenum-binding subunit